MEAKSQGSTTEFIVGDLHYATDKGPNAVSVNRGQVFTLLSRATSPGKSKLINFKQKRINWNHEAKKEIERMRKESRFVWKHQLTEIFRLCDMSFQYQVIESTYTSFSIGHNLYRLMHCVFFYKKIFKQLVL